LKFLEVLGFIFKVIINAETDGSREREKKRSEADSRGEEGRGEERRGEERRREEKRREEKRREEKRREEKR
jgi:hypothetical protein